MSFLHIITDDSRRGMEIKKRIAMATNIFNKMRRVLISREINSAMNMRILKCYVSSTLLYVQKPGH